MRFFMLFFICGLLGLPSCGDQVSCTLSQGELLDVLVDIQIAETAAQSLTGTVKDSIQELYYRQIFEIHGIEEEVFKTCFDELQADPERMSAMYEKIVEEMKLHGAKQQEKKEAEVGD